MRVWTLCTILKSELEIIPGELLIKHSLIKYSLTHQPLLTALTISHHQNEMQACLLTDHLPSSQLHSSSTSFSMYTINPLSFSKPYTSLEVLTLHYHFSCPSNAQLLGSMQYLLFPTAAGILWSQTHISFTDDSSAWFTVFPFATTPVIIPSGFNLHRDAPPKSVGFSVPWSLHFQQPFPQLTSATHPHSHTPDFMTSTKVTTPKL